MTNKILTGVCALIGLGMVIFGANKFFNFMPMPKDMPEATMAAFGNLMGLKWVLPLAGIAEIVGGILLALPKTRTVGALVLLPVVVGIFCHNMVIDQSGLPIAAVFLGVVVWALFSAKDKLMGLLN